MPAVNITPRIEQTNEGTSRVLTSFCENCGEQVTRSVIPPGATVEQVRAMARADGETFLAHLERHYPPPMTGNN